MTDTLLKIKESHPDLYSRAISVDSSPITVGDSVIFTNKQGEQLTLGANIQAFTAAGLPMDPLDWFHTPSPTTPRRVRAKAQHRMVRSAATIIEELDRFIAEG